MLSIVIPIFNQDVRTLDYTLVKQCNKLNINYQVLCFDDGSEQKYKEFNKELAFKINVNYTEMPENLGRSKIRNWLGKAAYYEYILFLDGDSTIKNKDFIKTIRDDITLLDDSTTSLENVKPNNFYFDGSETIKSKRYKYY